VLGAADGLALADVNGAILAIVVAGLLGYLFLAYQTLDRMETELIEEANGINGVWFRRRSSVGDLRDAIGRLGIRELQSLFTLLALGFPTDHDRSIGFLMQGYELPRPEDFAARRRVLNEVTGAIPCQYPFVGEGDQPIPLNHIADIRKWLPRLEESVNELEEGLSGRRDHLSRLAAADHVRRERLNPAFETAIAAGEDRRADMLDEARNFHSNAFSSFLDHFETCSGIGRATRSRLDTLDRYRRRFPSRTLVLAATSFVVVAFVCGVAIPMVHRHLHGLARLRRHSDHPALPATDLTTARRRIGAGTGASVDFRCA
jgi:hypothetical protein